LLQAARALSAWGATLYGFVAVLALTPLAGYAALALPLAPRELALGLAVFCCMPTTLSSGVSLTQAPALICYSFNTYPNFISFASLAHNLSLQAVARRSDGTLTLPGGGCAGQRLRSAACDTRCQAAEQRDRCAAARRWAATRRWRCC